MIKDIIILSSFFKNDITKGIINSIDNKNELSSESLVKEINNRSFFSRIDLNQYISKFFSSKEIFLGDKFLLNKLCLEESIKYIDEDNIIANIIKNYKPKIIILRDIGTYSIKKLIQIKNNLKINFKIILLNGFPIRDIRDYSLFDLVIFRNPWLIKKFGKNCKNYELIYHCFNSNILNNLKINSFNNRNNLVSFDGSSYSHGMYDHKKRYFYLYKLIEQKLISCNIYENNSNFHYFIYFIFKITQKNIYSKKIILAILECTKSINKKIFNKYYKKIQNIIDIIQNFNSDNYNFFYRGPLKKNFPKIVGEPKFGLEYYENINNSKISINIHTESMSNYIGNIRTFEITGLASCMLIEKFENLSDLYEDGKDVVSYTSFEDLKDKLYFLKQNPKFVEKIAQSGFKKTLNHHTDKSRADIYINIINKII